MKSSTPTGRLRNAEPDWLGNIARPSWPAFIVAALACVLQATAHAELTVVSEESDKGRLTIYQLSVTPAAEPTPALKHRFVPEAIDMRPGNAALHYTRSFAEGGVAAVWKAIEKEHGFDTVHGGDDGHAWYSTEAPLDELPLEAARAAAAQFDTLVTQFVSRATVRYDCDWGHNIEELRGPEIFATLLPEIQETRSLSRGLMLRTRVAVADGDYDRAIDHLRMNYCMAQHVAKGPFLVSGLVGIAEASMSNAEVVELIAAQDSPNLYWALAELPRPFIDLRPSVRFEMSSAMRVFPFLLDPENQEHSPAGWAALLAEGLADTQSLGSGGPKYDPWVMQAGVAGISLFAYPDAKRRLVAGGMDADRVEQMPVGQVIAVDAIREFRRLADEYEKSWYLPYSLGKVAEDKADKLVAGNKLRGGYGHVLASLLLPALQAVRNAQMRLEWQLDALMAVEAIRMHAAATGKLSQKLDEITIVPTPKNPATEAPFEYRLDGDAAVLELPFSDGFTGVAYRYEIKLAAE